MMDGLRKASGIFVYPFPLQNNERALVQSGKSKSSTLKTNKRKLHSL